MRTAWKIPLALLLAAATAGLVPAGPAWAGEPAPDPSTAPAADAAQVEPPPPPPAAPAPDAFDLHGAMQSASGFAQEATRPDTWFPAWHLTSSRNIDPRIRPNAGLRIPRSYYPIAGGPLLYPNFSPTEPDYVGGQPTEPWSVKQSLGLFAVGDDHVSSKFQEFRDVRTGFTAGIEGHYRHDNDVFNIVARQIGRGDQDLAIDGGRAGSYQFNLGYSETPHNYAFDAKSLWGGVGTRALTLPDAMQADLQSSTTLPQLSGKMLGYVSAAPVIDEALHRQTLSADVSILATYPFVVKLAASNESREGIRPWSGSFGFNNFVEIPWPVKYDTQEVRVTGEFAKPESRIYANASFRVSEFVDHIQSFTFDNPDRIVDGPGALGCTFLCGPVMGRMSLYPSNQYYDVSGTFAVKKLPFNSTFNAFVSAGFMRQNEQLLPYSTNSADPPLKSLVSPSFNATDPSGLPRQTAETAMNTQTVSMRWTSDLSPKVRLVGQYRFYGLDNNEKMLTMYQFVREDEDIRNPETAGGTYKTVLAAFSKHTATLEGTYNLSPLSKVTAVYTFERMNREFREVKWMNDHKLKLEYDTVLGGAVEVKSWYERSQRTTSVYEFDQYNIVQGNQLGHPMLPWIEKFDEAPYGRNEAQVMATWAISDTSSVSAHLQLVGTDYGVARLGPLSMATENVTAQASKAYQFGVRDDHRQSLGADYTWAPTDRLSAFVEAGYERQGYQSMSRQWTVNGISDPYLRQRTLESNSNWIANARDNYLTAGAGLDAQLVPDKVKLSFQYVFSRSDGRQSYSSPIGTAAVDDVNAFDPQPFDDVDDTTTHSFNPELSYQYNEHLSIAAGYQWEKWSVNDYNYKGFTYAPVYTTGVALLMGGLLPKPYTQNIAYVRVRMGF
jgi:MtrB/PioB family decaheme-associated outer membrane protein